MPPVGDFEEMEEAAIGVLRILKTVPEFGAAKVAVIGGMALWKHMPRYRNTNVGIEIYP